MSSTETNIDKSYFDIGSVRFRRRFENPKSPEGFRYGFLFRLVYCLVAFLSTSLSIVIVTAIAKLIGFDQPAPASGFVVLVAVISYSIPVFFGEVLRRRILDFTEKSEDGSVTVELTRSGFSLDGEKILRDWDQKQDELREIEIRATEHEGHIKTSSDFWKFELIERSVHIYGRQSFYVLFGKRVFDLTVVILALGVWVPLFVLLAALVGVTSKGPIFFAQQRVGKDGKVFRIVKFRTMFVDADEQLKEYLAENSSAKAEWDARQMLSQDPRITPLGRILRKTSLDEIPQFLNVINGSMSLVGPRPMMISQTSMYSGTAYYRMRPGITGYWQVSSRNSGSFDERVKHDDLYETEISLWTDFLILFRTISVVLRATGY